MTATISNQLFGAFLMFLVLQPFVAKSRPVKFDHGHNNVKQSPGCGITHGKSDGVFHLVENYSFFNADPKWENFPVTYGFRSGFPLPAGLDSQEVEDAIDAAVLEWQTAVPKFAFQKVEPGDGADINIAFAELSGTKYGFAYAPPNGSLFLVIDTNWSTSSNLGTLQLDLESGAIHEIGHTLGLDHSEFEDAVMFATLYILELPEGNLAKMTLMSFRLYMPSNNLLQ